MQWLASISVQSAGLCDGHHALADRRRRVRLHAAGARSLSQGRLSHRRRHDPLPGAAPEEVETEITDKIEEAVNTISGIDELRSNSSEGVSQVIVAFLLEKDARRRRAGSARPREPRAPAAPAHDRSADGREVRPGFGAGADARRSRRTKPIRDITEYADKTLRRQLESVSGVGQVVVVGGRARQINIALDADQAARVQPHGHRRVARPAGAEHRDSRRPRRAGRHRDDAAHARPGRVGRRVRRHRGPPARRPSRSSCATSRRSRTAWPSRTPRRAWTASPASC